VKAVVPVLLIAGLVALCAGSGFASAVSFDLSYSDPASDVVELWTSNMTPVLNATGNVTMSPNPDSVNIVGLSSANATADIALSIQVKGNIVDLDNTTYQVRLYTRTDNASHFEITYRNRATTLTSTASGFFPVDLSSGTTISRRSTLVVNVGKWLFGTITAYDIDATATQVGTVYTFQDFAWSLRGNPGSAPPGFLSTLPNWAWIALVPVVIALGILVVMMASQRRSTRPKKSAAPEDEELPPDPLGQGWSRQRLWRGARRIVTWIGRKRGPN
jgi:hypothetical protein